MPDLPRETSKANVALYIATIFIAIAIVLFLSLCIFFQIASIDPLDDAEKHINYNPTPLNLAAIDFSLRLLEVVGSERTNVVFSPEVIAEGLYWTYEASQPEAASQIARMVVDPNRFAEENSEYWFSGFHGLYSAVPYAGLIGEDSSTFGVKRRLTLAPEAERSLDEWFKSYLGISKAQIEQREKNRYTAFSYETGMTWIEQRLTQNTNIGNLRWNVSYSQGDLLQVATDVYCFYGWDFNESRERGKSCGIAPFRVNGETQMVPTVCIRREHAAVVNDDRESIAIRLPLDSLPDQVFWIVTMKGESSGRQKGTNFSVEDMEYWRHYDMRFMNGPRGHVSDTTTRWKSIQHIHFPSFSFESMLDLGDACRKLGANLAFDPLNDDSLKMAGVNARAGRFESNLSIAVNEDGIGPAHQNTSTEQPLTCDTPDLVVDSAFDFFLLKGHHLLLLGNVKDPTAPRDPTQVP